jgi:hypothetical protein
VGPLLRFRTVDAGGDGVSVLELGEGVASLVPVVDEGADLSAWPLTEGVV